MTAGGWGGGHKDTRPQRQSPPLTTTSRLPVSDSHFWGFHVTSHGLCVPGLAPSLSTTRRAPAFLPAPQHSAPAGAECHAATAQVRTAALCTCSRIRAARAAQLRAAQGRRRICAQAPPQGACALVSLRLEENQPDSEPESVPMEARSKAISVAERAHRQGHPMPGLLRTGDKRPDSARPWPLACPPGEERPRAVGRRSWKGIEESGRKAPSAVCSCCVSNSD